MGTRAKYRLSRETAQALADDTFELYIHSLESARGAANLQTNELLKDAMLFQLVANTFPPVAVDLDKTRPRGSA